MTCLPRAARLAALLALPAPCIAQPLPGRDLLDFPLGTIAEAPAFAGQAAGGLHNPAALRIPDGRRLRLSAAQLNASADQGVSGQVASAELRVRPRTIVGVSLARASVAQILRTDAGDPTAVGTVVYDATVLSATAAHRLTPKLAIGAAGRYRYGRQDTLSTGALGADVGIVVDQLTWVDARIGLSTYLWRPDAVRFDRPGLNAAVDARFAGSDAEHEARGGYSYARGGGGSAEHYVFTSGRLRNIEGRLGTARWSGASGAEWRTRLGLGLHYARFSVGVAREQSGAVLDPLYQFTISSVFK
jgi:hypothetical protein